MAREIYEVTAKIVDATGAYNTLSGYPKSFDSKNYDGDIEKARLRAEGEFHECLGAMCKRDDRQVQCVYIIRISDGAFIMSQSIGKFLEIPEPEPEVNE
jgi:hypothetical protein